MRLSEIVIKINKSLRKLQNAKVKEAESHANNNLKNLLFSSDAPGLFGHVFGTACAYKYLRRMSFFCLVEVGPDFNYYVAKLSMTCRDADEFPQLAARMYEVNKAFNQLDYPRLRSEAIEPPPFFIDDLTRVSFKLVTISPIQQVMDKALKNINKINFNISTTS